MPSNKNHEHKIVYSIDDRETHERVKFFKIFSYIGIFIGSILLVYDYFSGNLFTFYSVLAFLVILALNLLQVRIFKNYELGFIISIASFAVILIMLFLVGDGSMFVWIGPFGALAFFLMGSKRGFYICMSVFIVMSFFILADSLGTRQLPFPQSFKQLAPDFVASIIVLFLFILIFQETLEKKQKSITESIQQLEGEHEKDRSIFSIIETGLVTATEDGTITFINQPGWKLLAENPDKIIGKPIREIFQFKKDGKDASEKDNPFNQPLVDGVVRIKIDDNIDIKRLNGGSFPAGLNIIYSNQNEATRIALVFFDLSTEREINYLKDAFLSSMQHQISTPFSIIKWNVELLRESEENLIKTGLNRNGVINETQLAIDRINQIQKNILTASKLEHGLFPQDTELLNPKDMVNETIRYLYLNAKKKDISINLAAKDVEPIKTNKILLSIIIDNIVSNAIKYSPNNSVIDIQITQEEGKVLFKVIDRGIGIPQKDQAHIFDKFFRSDNVLKKTYEGTGLGLYICKILVLHLQGEIWFESAEGVGTTFYLRLPNNRR